MTEPRPGLWGGHYWLLMLIGLVVQFVGAYLAAFGALMVVDGMKESSGLAVAWGAPILGIGVCAVALGAILQLVAWAIRTTTTRSQLSPWWIVAPALLVVVHLTILALVKHFPPLPP